MIDPIAFYRPETAAIMGRKIEECGLSNSLAATLRGQGIGCAGRLLGVTTRTLLKLHEASTLSEADLTEIDDAICRLSTEIACKASDHG